MSLNVPVPMNIFLFLLEKRELFGVKKYLHHYHLQMGFSPVRNALLRSPLHCGNKTFLEAQVRDGLFPPAVPFKLLGESHKYILEI